MSTAFGASAGTAGAALAGTLPKPLAQYAHCPVDNPKVSACVHGVLTSGTFSIGSTTLTINQPEGINLGLEPQANGSLKVVPPDDGTAVLKGAPVPVSILGLPALPSPLNVTATPTLIQLPTFNVTALATGSGPAIRLPLDVSINNVLIGSGCTIGNAANPITLKMTTGKTNPPPPNKPIQGSPGKTTISDQGVVTITGMTLVDNAFAVPGAFGCGPLGLLDPIFDTAEGLPSAAGNNTGIFHANVGLAPATLIRKALG
ncbi:MAG: hypothetical protein J2P57_01475 [Acidimicrobiaceae bacterium]|nr:hypothetical protein [Acidimicrobiaceae bacterium]